MVFFHHIAIIIFIFFGRVFVSGKQGLFATFLGKRSHDFGTTLGKCDFNEKKSHKKMGKRDFPFSE